MTERSKEEDKRESELEQYPSLEDQPQHPGWVSLAKIFKKRDSISENIMFLLAYDFSCNVYVLRGDYLTIVDPGNDYTGFMELFKLDFKPEDIKKIVLTHGHRDHAMGAFELLSAYPSIMQSGGFELILHEASPSQFKVMAKELGCTVTQVRGGETLELSGFEWEVIYTPGHTIDGISLYHAPTKTAFTGDTVLPYGISDPDTKAGGRLDHYLFGVKELLKRNIENILPGHGVPVVSAGRRVIEVAYEDIMLKIIGVEGGIPWMEGAAKLVEKGLLEEAVFCSDKELARNPENLEAMQLKAFCLTDMGRCEESVELLDRILALQSDNLHAVLGKGHALLGLGKYDESLKYFDDVLGMNPEVKEAHIYKGMALYLSGRYDEAMDIEIFRTEFSERFKDQLGKKEQQAKQS